MPVKRRTARRKTTVTRTSARRCSCSVGELGRVRRKKTARKTTRKTGCKIIRIRGRGVRKGCYVNGRFRFQKM